MNHSCRTAFGLAALVVVLTALLGAPVVAQTAPADGDLPPRPDGMTPAPVIDPDTTQSWPINDHAWAHRFDEESPWSVTDQTCEPENPVLSPRKTTRECRIDPQTNEPYWYETTYQDYSCTTAPPHRRFISGFKKLGRCRRFDYGNSYTLAQTSYDESWPVLPQDINDPVPTEPPGGSKPGGGGDGGGGKGDGAGGGKLVHDSLLDKSCFMKHMWELWFDAFAKGLTPKGDVDIPAVPWSSVYVGGDGIDHYQTPGGQDLLKLPNGEVLEKRADGAWVQICPPESSTAGGTPPASAVPPAASDQPTSTEQPPGVGQPGSPDNPGSTGDSGDGDSGPPSDCPNGSEGGDCEPNGVKRIHQGQHDDGGHKKGK